MAELTLYHASPSRSSVVLWMLEEVGQPYDIKLLRLSEGENLKADYLAINPMGKVPALRHGDVVVTETAAICAYLADAFPQARLAPPPGDRLRGPYYRWLFFTAGPVEAAVSNKALGFVVPPERERMMGYGRVDTVLDTLEAAVSRSEHLVGDCFSAADLYVGSHLGFGMMFGTIEKRPAFAQYWQRLSARPAYVRAKERDDALVPPPQAQR
jgi:glutathione S-transferase